MVVWDQAISLNSVQNFPRQVNLLTENESRGGEAGPSERLQEAEDEEWGDGVGQQRHEQADARNTVADDYGREASDPVGEKSKSFW